MTFNNWLIKEDTDQPLGAIASQLRGKLFDRVYLRETVLVVALQKGKSASEEALLLMAGSVDPCVDIEISRGRKWM